MKKQNMLMLLAVVLILLPLVLSHETSQAHDEGIPANLQKLSDYNAEQAQYYFRSLTFLVAFLVGIIGILSPCSLAILPSYFAITFEEKKNLAKMTFIFFLGFAPVFIFFGMFAAFLGKTIAIFQQGNNILVGISGAFILLFGFMTIFGKGFSGVQIHKKVKGNAPGIFLFGMFFAIGFTACVGPALFGILLIAGTLQNYWYAVFLMFFYSLGLFSTLFIVSFFFDKYNFAGYMSKLNQKAGFSITNMVSGILLIGIGITFLFYGGTSFLTGKLGLGDFTVKIYNLMDNIIASNFSNYLGAILLILFGIFLWKILSGKTAGGGR